MSSSQSDIRDGFIRQRRNLLLISLTIFLLYFWGVEFTEIDILGNKIKLDDGNNVFPVLWILMGYWLWRYRHYMSELGNLGVSGIFFQKRAEVINRRIVNKANSATFWNDIRNSNPDYDFTNQQKIDTFDIQHKRDGYFSLTLELLIRTESKPNRPLGNKFTVNYEIKPFSLFKANAISIWYLINNTRAFSEYFLPPLMAFLVGLYCLIFHTLPVS